VRYVTTAALIVLVAVQPAQAQFRARARLRGLNERIEGRVVDYTRNLRGDNRLYSPILGESRDLYIYLPPGYTPTRAYPLILYLHMAFVDERRFVASNRVIELDEMIEAGQFPPAIVAIPDGLIGPGDPLRAPHSLFVNGVSGRFEDHLLQEVVPFVRAHYSVRPEREAHALIGVSAGGFGAASIALRHADEFGAVATIGAPLNLRYTTCDNNVREDFDPATFRWKQNYDPDEIVATFYFGLSRVPAKKYLTPVFGDDVAAVPRLVAAVNPADLLFTASPRPGHPAMYVNFAGRDNWNFDAQAQSFLWLAAQRGFPVDSDCVPGARHNLPYFRTNHVPAYRWLASHLLPPTDVGTLSVSR
jgi:S-formylglutathione hydrolase FrmB